MDRVVDAIRSFGKIIDFAEASGIPYNSLKEYAIGKRKPGLDALAAIIKTSGVNTEWLIHGHGPKFPDGKPFQSEVDEQLFGRIARLVGQSYAEIQKGSDKNTSMAGETTENDYLTTVIENTLISAHVYNKAAKIEEGREREKTIEDGVKEFVAFSKYVRDAKTPQA